MSWAPSARPCPSFRWPLPRSPLCAQKRKARAAVISRPCGRARMPADARRYRPPISRGNWPRVSNGWLPNQKQKIEQVKKHEREGREGSRRRTRNMNRQGRQARQARQEKLKRGHEGHRGHRGKTKNKGNETARAWLRMM